ncbi:sodium:calcium antiporter [Neptunicoccus cionae]|uniref:K+-dependent Na+/Ca+ exchanger n=1 Tax=Neptunicoccus cionae TaxID=2035344 RepID=A0A916QZG4_9RHOB|nr:sodium:calcium antiporter [Amylibacter cionae]GGA21985.1 K+-dependent Na+/Ca+ exchanger [Amylibacter cionae]
MIFLLAALPLCLAIVVVSAGFFVKGAVSIAHRLSVPEFLVGSVIVAIGTSAPEVAINVSAVLEGAGDIVISNIVGSNIVNIGLGVGLAGFMLSFDRARPEYMKSILVGLLGTVALLANTILTSNGMVSSHFGLLYSALILIIFAYYMYSSIKNADGSDDEEIDAGAPLWLALIFVVGGAIAMAFFSDMAVHFAVSLSKSMGISEAVIGATVIAAGGSLPEVSSCIAAARIKRPNLILGNVAGSQIFNILGILGLSGLIRPFDYSTVLWVDIAILAAMTVFLLACIRYFALRRFIGTLLFGSYACYAGYLIYIST